MPARHVIASVRCVTPFGTTKGGTNGKVLEAHLESDGYSVEIEWDWPPGPKLPMGRVSKTEFETCQIEL